MADAVGAIGDAEAEATGVVLGVVGDMSASVLLLFTPNDAARCAASWASRPAPRSATPR